MYRVSAMASHGELYHFTSDYWPSWLSAISQDGSVTAPNGYWCKVIKVELLPVNS